MDAAPSPAPALGPFSDDEGPTDSDSICSESPAGVQIGQQVEDVHSASPDSDTRTEIQLTDHSSHVQDRDGDKNEENLDKATDVQLANSAEHEPPSDESPGSNSKSNSNNASSTINTTNSNNANSSNNVSPVPQSPASKSVNSEYDLKKFGLSSQDKVLESFSCALYPKKGLPNHGRYTRTKSFSIYSVCTDL
jgi:hypothetical protein